MKEADIKQENEQEIQEIIKSKLSGMNTMSFSYQVDLSEIIRNLSEAYKNLKESE